TPHPLARRESAFVRGVESVHQFGRDAAAVGDLLSLVTRPFPDGLVLRLVAGAPGGPADRALLAATYPAGFVHIGRQRFPQSFRVRRRQVDVVLDAVQAECDALS